MKIDFKTRDLKKCASDKRYAIRKLGATRAELFFKRIGLLYNAISFEDLREVPGHFHELNHGRKGQWGFDLDQPYRLIVTPANRPIKVDDNGNFIWDFIQDVVIVEIINYHKEK